MTPTPTVRDDLAQRILGYKLPVTSTNEAIHGVTCVNGRLVLASGEYLSRLSLETGHLVDQLLTFPAPGGLAFDGCHIWQHAPGAVQQLDPRTGSVVRSFALELQGVTGVECIAGDLLILKAAGRSLARIRVLDYTRRGPLVVSETETSAPLKGLSWNNSGELWSSQGDSLVRIDPSSARVLARLSLPGAYQVCDLAADPEGRFWCVDGSSREVCAFAPPDTPKDERRSFTRASPSALVVDLSTTPHATENAVLQTPSTICGTIFARILVPVDFGPGSRRAVATALLLQEQLKSKVHLIHITEQGANDEFLAGIGAGSVPPAQLVDDAKARLRQLVDDLFPGSGAGVEVHARIGANVVGAIERAVDEIRPTLLLLAGTQRHTVFRTQIERITRRVDAAVMVVRAALEPPFASRSASRIVQVSG